MISIVARLLINVESLNSVESIGNLTKHRTAPVIFRTKEGYTVSYEPVLSGEMLGHGYQVGLVEEAKKLGLPLGKYSAQYEFIKFSSDKVLEEEGITPPKAVKQSKKKSSEEEKEEVTSDKLEEEMRRFEVEVMLRDTVADIAGFMYPGSISVRRTSRFKVGYAVPIMMSDEAVAFLETQFHTRLVHTAEKGKQSIYNIEIASALYTMTFQLDEDLITVPSTPVKDGVKVKGEEELTNQKQKRVQASLRALYYILTGNFGGKRTRLLPQMELTSLVMTHTDFSFIPTPGHNNNYIENTITRLEKAKKVLDGKVAKVYMINNEGLNVSKQVNIVSSPEELIEALLDEVNQQ